MWTPWNAWHLAGMLAQGYGALGQLAQAGGGGSDIPWDRVVTWGAGGVALALVASGRWFRLTREVVTAEKALEAERTAHAETKKELADERRAHNETRAVTFNALTADVVPALIRSTEALEDLAGGHKRRSDGGRG